MINEIWKDIPGFGDNYQVSDTGKVKNIKTGRVLRQNISNGYYVVGLVSNGKAFTRSVHSLMALAFFGPRPLDELDHPFVVNHKDGEKLHNVINNLEYISTWENTQHYHYTLKPLRG